MALRVPATYPDFRRSLLQSTLWNGLSSETPNDIHCSSFDLSFRLKLEIIPRTIALGSVISNDLIGVKTFKNIIGISEDILG